MAFVVATLDEVFRARAHLKAQGVTIEDAFALTPPVRNLR
jgi:hypothetical protein